MKRLETLIIGILFFICFSCFLSCKEDDPKPDIDYAADKSGMYVGALTSLSDEELSFDDFVIQVSSPQKNVITLKLEHFSNLFWHVEITAFVNDDNTFHWGDDDYILSLEGSFEEGDIMDFRIYKYIPYDHAYVNIYHYRGEKNNDYNIEEDLLPRRIITRLHIDKMEFDYDECNRLKSIHSTGRAFNNFDCDFFYNEQGQLIKHTFAFYESISTYSYEYEDNIIKILADFALGVDLFIVTLNDKGECVNIAEYVNDRFLVDNDFYYDENSNVVKIEGLDNVGVFRSKTMEYDNTEGIFSGINAPKWFFFVQDWLYRVYEGENNQHCLPYLFYLQNNIIHSENLDGEEDNYEYTLNISQYPTTVMKNGKDFMYVNYQKAK